jgi:4-amino-4-deoxy-L-arabinose transferase-like glycosyltransferase
LLARGVEAWVEGSVFNDGPRFVAMAVALLAGDWRTALADDFHPLTSIAMAVTSQGLGLHLEAAAELVSVVSGAVAAFAIWRLSFEQLGSRVALVAGLVFALHPRLRESSSGVQSDGLHLAWFALAALFVWRSLEQRRLALAAVAGLCTGFGYLTRPEALAVGVVFAGWLAADLVGRRLPLRRAVSLGAAYAIALAAVGLPYVVALHEIDGKWSITHKKDITGWVPAVLPGSSDPTPASPPPVPAPAADPTPAAAAQAPPAPAQAAIEPTRPTGLSEVAKDGLRSFHPILLGLAAIGVGAILRGERKERRVVAYSLSFSLLFLALLVAVHVMAGYVSRRHFLPAVALLVPLAGLGVLGLSDAIVQRVPKLRAWRVAPALGVAIMLGIFIEMLLPSGEPSKRAREDAARWLREHHAPTAVASHRARDAYYAGAAHVPLFYDVGPDEMLRSAHQHGARFVILDRDGRSDSDLPGWVQVIHREKRVGAEVLVLELSP